MYKDICLCACKHIAKKKLSCTVQLMMQSFSIYRSAMHVVLPYTHTIPLQRGTTANIVPLPIRYHQNHKMAVKTELPHSTADDTDLLHTNISYTCGAATHPHSTIVQICHCREAHCQYSSAACCHAIPSNPQHGHTNGAAVHTANMLTHIFYDP